jgi:predicted esterase
MNTFTPFDKIRIAYHDEGEGPVVILLHGFGVDGLGQFGDFERILPIREQQEKTLRILCDAKNACPAWHVITFTKV